jgi:hypothetical protein
MMFENFQLMRYRYTIITGLWTPLLQDFFRRNFLCERPTRRFSRATSRVFL